MESKKQILEQIEKVRQQAKKGELTSEVVEQEYKMINQAIDQMKDKVKTNTIVYLQNQLNTALFKFRTEGSKQKKDHFLEFFKEAYPDGKRDKTYTLALADKNKISVDQIVETLKSINTYCMKERLAEEAKIDIFPMIEKVARTDSLRHINQVRSMEGIRKAFRIKIVSTPKGHKVVKQ